MNYTIQVLTDHDIEKFSDLLSVFEIVFEMTPFEKPSHDYLKQLLQKPNFLPVVAVSDQKIIAGMTVYVLDGYYSPSPMAFIYDLAVLPDFQRKGVGKSLIEFIKNYCEKKSFQDVFVFADAVDEYAIDFYRSTKPTTESLAVYFNYVIEN